MLGALTAFGPVSVDLYLPAFTAIAEDLGAPVSSVQLSLSTYLAGLALGQLAYGPLSDSYGRRRPLVAGIALYVVASVACALAPSVSALIGFRLLQGLGGCAGIVIARAIVRDLFAGAEAARFFSLLLLVFGVAPVAAPLLGGQILAAVGWRGIFVALAGYGLACIAGALWLPETLPRRLRRAAGLRSALHSYRTVAGNRSLVAYATVVSFGGAALLAYIAASPAVVIEEHGVSPQAFGFVFGANAVGFVVVSQVGGRLVGRVGPEALLRAGVLAQTLAGAVLLVLAVAGAGLAALLPPMFVIVASVGAILPSATALGLTPFPANAGAAAAVIGTGQAALSAASGAVVSAIALAVPAEMAMGIVVTAACLVTVSAIVFLVPPRPHILPEQVV